MTNERTGPQELLDATERLIETLDETGTDTTYVELHEAAHAHRDQPDSEAHKLRLGEHLHATLERFEVEHPAITKAINDVAQHLSGLGI